MKLITPNTTEVAMILGGHRSAQPLWWLQTLLMFAVEGERMEIEEAGDQALVKFKIDCQNNSLSLVTVAPGTLFVNAQGNPVRAAELREGSKLLADNGATYTVTDKPSKTRARAVQTNARTANGLKLAE